MLGVVAADRDALRRLLSQQALSVLTLWFNRLAAAIGSI